MKTLLVLSFLIIPNLLLAQSIDSLKAQIAKLEQNGYSLDLKIDSLEKERRSISNKVSELTRFD